MLSIIIPTLNEEKILEKTLKSLSEYTGDHEIIISDGRSTDRTVEIAHQYGAKVVIYEGEKRQTIGQARNMGVREARGDMILFLDADMTIPDPNTFFPKALAIFQNNPKLIAMTVYLKVFPEFATLSDRVVFWCFNRLVFLYNNVFHIGASSGEFQMVRTEVFKKVGGFNESLVAGEDFDMFHRLAKIGITRSESSLFVLHTSRRAHKIGWPKLLYSWFMNYVHAAFSGKAYSTVWEEVR